MAAREVNCKLSLLEFLERVQLHLMAGVLVTLTDQSNVSCHLLTHFCSATAGQTLALREQVDLCPTGQAVTPSAVLGLRRQGLWGLKRPEVLTMTRGERIQSELICWGGCASHPTPPPSTRQPVLQLITGLGSKMGQMSTPGALPENRGSLARSRSCHCQAISHGPRQGYLHV